jgi:hypothetical protein
MLHFTDHRYTILDTPDRLDAIPLINHNETVVCFLAW